MHTSLFSILAFFYAKTGIGTVQSAAPTSTAAPSFTYVSEVSEPPCPARRPGHPHPPSWEISYSFSYLSSRTWSCSEAWPPPTPPSSQRVPSHTRHHATWSLAYSSPVLWDSQIFHATANFSSANSAECRFIAVCLVARISVNAHDSESSDWQEADILA